MPKRHSEKRALKIRDHQGRHGGGKGQEERLVAEGKVMEQAAGSPGAQHRADGCRQHRGALCPSSRLWCQEARAVPLSPAEFMG